MSDEPIFDEFLLGIELFEQSEMHNKNETVSVLHKIKTVFVNFTHHKLLPKHIR